jgi:hypothetical protein
VSAFPQEADPRLELHPHRQPGYDRRIFDFTTGACWPFCTGRVVALQIPSLQSVISSLWELAAN